MKISIIKNLYWAIPFLFVLNSTAVTITIGNGAATNNIFDYPAPYGNWFWGAKHQFLITATELTNAGMSAGDINSLAFDVDVAVGQPLQGFTISMKNTLVANLTVFETGLTTVYGPQTYTESAGLNTHLFTSSFYWDGTSNILVETCFNNPAFSWNGNASTFYTTTTHTSSVYFRQDATNVCTSNMITATSNNRPNMIFDWTPATVPPVSNFSANSTFTCSGLIHFNDESNNNPTSWSWDFGDGDTSSTQNPIHTYTVDGTYDVTLITCNAFGCDTLTQSNYITVNTSAPTPINASCTPTTTNYCCGFGITNVTFNTINNTSNDGTDGYSDFTCTQTTILEGQSYNLSIQSNGASSTQNYAAWIDFNNDGVLDDNTERVLTTSSSNAASGTVNIPVGATLNSPLRLRVAADYDFNAAPTPCTNLTQGQAEDYTVIINPNPNPPTPIFSASETTTCSGSVCFTDESLNVPTGWLWDFGDGNTSFQQNPCHTYTTDGTYTVTLTATNSNGGNTDSITNYITVNMANQVVAASCTPATNAYCCGYGINRVVFNTINHSSSDGVEGYQDFSCVHNTTVTEGTGYNLSVITGNQNAQDTRVWLDLNNDGTFNNTNELILDVSNSFNASAVITIPTGGVLNTPLRMRVSSDVVGTAQSACDNNDFGQTEDYAVVIQPDNMPPNSIFSATPTVTCFDTINFTDNSTGSPTSWLWNFGDGTTSTLPNPTHFYTLAGTYTVSLKVTNAFGQDSTALNNYITVDCSNLNMPTSGTHVVTACDGTLFDNGGPFGNYSNLTDGTIILQPPTQIIVTFTFFDFVAASAGDTLFIYDGPSVNSPLLHALTGNAAIPALIVGNNGITIRQKTDILFNDPGFELNWTCMVGINEVGSLSDKVNIYPNPASDILNVEFYELSDFNVKEIGLYNSLGQLILKNTNFGEQKTIRLDVAALEGGLYFVKIVNVNGEFVTKKVNIR